MGFQGIIYDIVHEFLDCWNRKEIKGLLHLFKHGAVYQTPNAALLFPDRPDGRLTSIEEIEMYLTRLFESPAYFTTELMGVEKVD
ncbi:MAG: hypothetical protein JNJ58_04600 [Chitinophagaceae bacterium]|nr:hypothetical protein [Chitinophagaceae bacterium]